MPKEYILAFLFTVSSVFLHAQTPVNEDSWLGQLKVGTRFQKTQKLYWENGFTAELTSPKLVNNRVHLGLSYVSSRLGSAVGTNAIKQDNFMLNLGYYFRPEKDLQPFARLNTGYFHADYEYEIFDVLPNNAFLLSVDAGLSYEFKVPFTINLSAGYNLNTGDGSSGPGTLYPVFYQMSLYYTIFKRRTYDN